MNSCRYPCSCPCEFVKERIADRVTLCPFKAGRMAEIMADGIGADMSFRDATNSRPHDVKLVGGTVTRSQDGCKSPSASHTSTSSHHPAFSLIVCPLLTLQMAKTSRKITITISVHDLVQENKNNDKGKSQTPISAPQGQVRAQSGGYTFRQAISSTLPPGLVVLCFTHHFP